MAGWKLSTFLFAGATLFLLGRDLLRPPPAPPRAEPPPGPVVPPAGPRADEAAPPALPPEERDLPAAADELVFTVLFREPGLSWEERLALLAPRRAEIARTLEGWIARAEEVYAAGGTLEPALIAYARLLGKDAVPALERLAVEKEGGRPGVEAVAALAWVEHADATQAILRLQARKPPGAVVIAEYHLLGKTKAAEEVVRSWEAVPEFRESARSALFVFGSPAERERVWQSASRDEQRALLRRLRHAWPGWAGRPPHTAASVIETAERFLASADARERGAAIEAILRCPDAFPPATVASAERALAEAPEDAGLESIRREWNERREDLERQERLRAIFVR